MTDLDPKALEAACEAYLDYPADNVEGVGPVVSQPRAMEAAIRAYLSALPASPVAVQVKPPVVDTRPSPDRFVAVQSEINPDVWYVADDHVALLRTEVGVSNPEDIAKRAATGLNADALRFSPEAEWRPTHRHKKTGGEYRLIGIGRMQAGDWSIAVIDSDEDGINRWAYRSVDMREVAIYVGADGQHWVRPREEFEDGRFEPLPASPEREG